MSSSTTLRTLARREAVLVSSVAIAVAVLALAEALSSPWLRVASLAIAALGAIARGGIALKRARLERKSERVESARNFYVPIVPISTIDPTLIGVDKAEQTILAGGAIPRYIRRGVDHALRTAVDSAFEGTGPWMVVAIGASKVGKSRSLFEALRQSAHPETIAFVAPVNGDALSSMLTPGQIVEKVSSQRAVLWLADLETFLNEGITMARLREWHAGQPGRVVAAAYGGKGNELIAGTPVGALSTVANDVLQHANRVRMMPTTHDEIAELLPSLSTGQAAALERYGLAAYVIAGPRLEDKLTTGCHAPGEDFCPEGQALIFAAIDWARCGRTDPISEDALRALFPGYLPVGCRATDESFERGLVWALRPVVGTIALLQFIGSYEAYDYVVRLVRDRPGVTSPPDIAWEVALQDAVDSQASAVAVTAYGWSRYTDAIVGFKLASESSLNEIAVVAGLNHGVVLGRLDRSAEAVAVYDEVSTRFGADTEPGIREQVAKALVNKEAMLG